MSNSNIHGPMNHEKIVNALERTKEVMDDVNKHHFVSTLSNKAVFCREILNNKCEIEVKEYSKRDFLDLYNQLDTVYGPLGNKLAWQNVMDFWINNKDRRQYEKNIFEPNCSDKRFYNYWRGFYIKDDQVGDFPHIAHHLKHVWCNGDEEKYTYLLKWFAHLFQYPEKMPGVALVIKGEKGTGKSGFIDAIGQKILGNMYIKVTDPKHLIGHFNFHLFGKLLVVSEEAIWAGDKSKEGKLKSMITDSQIIIERKGYDAEMVNNYLRFIFLTNETFSVPATYDERRFFALRISSEYKKDKQYFMNLYNAMNECEIVQFFNYLKEYKFNEIDILTPPVTSALFEDIKAGMDIFDRWLYDLIDCYSANEKPELDNNNWLDSALKIYFNKRVKTKNLFLSYSRYMEYAKSHGIYYSSPKVSSQTMMTQILTNGKDGSYSFVKGRESEGTYIKFPAVENAKKIFEDKFSCKIEWSHAEFFID